MKRAMLAVLGSLFATTPLAQTGGQNNLWLMWEQVAPLAPGCNLAAGCEPPSELRSHFLMGVPEVQARTLFQQLEPSARYYGSANLTHEQLPICFDGPDGDGVSIPANLTEVPYAEKIDTLRGLQGVFADFRGARGPAGFRGQFGEEANEFLVTQFSQAGIPLLTKDQLPTAPGRPILGIRFSPEVLGCRPWSVSLSLKQDLLLARDPSLMISSTTWSASQGQKESDADISAREAFQNAILAFVEAYTQANTPETDEVSEAAASQ